MDFAAKLETIERTAITDLVRRAVRSDTVNVVDWRYQAIHGGGGSSTGGVYRFMGDGLDRGKPIPWSFILKISCAPDHAGNDTGTWNREALAYRSGVLDDLPGGLAAPRCLGISEYQSEGTWLWLEDVRDSASSPWSLALWQDTAGRLGRFNGAYLTGHPLPLDPWLSKEWLRGYVEGAAPMIARLPDLFGHPLIRHLFPEDTVHQLLQFWEEREIFLNALNQLPQTFCHLDAVRRNVLIQWRPEGVGDIVAVDWAFAGKGALGQELAALIVGNALLYEAELAELPALEEASVAGYLQGLRDSGWFGDQRLVWLGYSAATALRFTMYGVVRMGILLDPTRHAWAERALGHSLTDFVGRVAAIRGFALSQAQKARELIDILF